jgi:hypothetical protein
MKYLCVGGTQHGKMIEIEGRPKRAIVNGEQYQHMCRGVGSGVPFAPMLRYHFYVPDGMQRDDNLLIMALILSSGSALTKTANSQCD